MKPPQGPVSSVLSSKPIVGGVVRLKCAVAVEASRRAAVATDLKEDMVAFGYVAQD